MSFEEGGATSDKQKESHNLEFGEHGTFKGLVVRPSIHEQSFLLLLQSFQ